MEGWAYEDVLAFAQSWGAVYFSAMFIAVIAYALWPSNKQRFAEAAQVPLHDDDEDK